MAVAIVIQGEPIFVKDDLCSQDKAHIACQILAYLIDHPDAQDTLDGIIEWWLLERKIRYQTNMVRKTIADLVERGFILERKMAGSEISYKINNKSTEKILEFLKQSA